MAKLQYLLNRNADTVLVRVHMPHTCMSAPDGFINSLVSNAWFINVAKGSAGEKHFYLPHQHQMQLQIHIPLLS